jgi:transposase
VKWREIVDDPEREAMRRHDEVGVFHDQIIDERDSVVGTEWLPRLAILDRTTRGARRVAFDHPAPVHGIDDKFTTNPAAEAKIHDVVGLYLNVPTSAVVLSVDEKTQIQALSQTQPLLPLRPGLPARQTHDYRRNGLTSLYAALEIASGTVVGECRPRHTGADFLAFLHRLARTYRQPDLHVILDNSSTHTTPAVHAWLAAHPRMHFHFTPTGASWLNMVEAWFSILTRKSVRRGSFDTARALIRHIERYLAGWNGIPRHLFGRSSPRTSSTRPSVGGLAR